MSEATAEQRSNTPSKKKEGGDIFSQNRKPSSTGGVRGAQTGEWWLDVNYVEEIPLSEAFG